MQYQIQAILRFNVSNMTYARTKAYATTGWAPSISIRRGMVKNVNEESSAQVVYFEKKKVQVRLDESTGSVPGEADLISC